MHLNKAIATSTFLACLVAATMPMAHAQEDIIVVDTVRPTLYMNGGIGADEQSYMKKTAKDFNLHLVFSEHKDDEYVSDVKLSIVDMRGNIVFYLPSAGPLTNLNLADGKYRVSATFKGMTESQTVTVNGKQGKDLSFHWNKSPK